MNLIVGIAVVVTLLSHIVKSLIKYSEFLSAYSCILTTDFAMFFNVSNDLNLFCVLAAFRRHEEMMQQMPSNSIP
jgi:hypothetical protein